MRRSAVFAKAAVKPASEREREGNVYTGLRPQCAELRLETRHENSALEARPAQSGQTARSNPPNAAATPKRARPARFDLQENAPQHWLAPGASPRRHFAISRAKAASSVKKLFVISRSGVPQFHAVILHRGDTGERLGVGVGQCDARRSRQLAQRVRRRR